MESTGCKDTSRLLQNDLQHFILTRFNLLIFNKNKKEESVRTIKWLEHRFALFETYCLPSIKNQTCQDFEWIVLFDSTTPERFKKKVVEYQKICPQFIPVYVEPENGRFFAQIFRREIVKRLNAKRVLTTYLDNDDALNARFVDELHSRVAEKEVGTFFYYDEGFQYFTEGQYVMRIHYPKNHFVSVVEEGNPKQLKGIYGYGSHYYIDKIEGVKIEHIMLQAMWCEVIHERNIGNDAYFLKAKMVRDEDLLRREFAIDETVKSGLGIYLFKFLPRYGRTFVRRTKNYLKRRMLNI